MNRKFTSLALGASSFALAVAAFAPAASAQSLQYGSMEEIFGEPVTEGATGTPKRASETPVNMTIITSDEIRRSGARDMIEVLRRHAGIDVNRLTETGAQIAVRGMNFDAGRLRVLINGRDTFRTFEGLTQWANLPVTLQEIRQIEVVRGPATALYGANAVTGVINIITFNPLYDDASNVTARIGDNGLKEVTGNATLKLNDKAGVRLSGGYIEADAFDAVRNGPQALTRLPADNNWFSVDSLFQANDWLQAGLEMTYFDGNVNTMNWLGDLSNGATEDYSVKGTLNAETSMGRWTFTAFLNNNTENRISAVNLPTGPISFAQSIKAESHFFDLTNIQTVGTNTGLRLSAGYREDKVAQFGGSIADDTGDVGYDTVYASFLVDQPLGDKVTLDVSGRYDHISTYRTALELPFLPFDNDDYGNFGALSANVGLVYKPTEIDTFKLMYARGFLAPNLFDIGGQIIAQLAPGLPVGAVFPGIQATGGHPETEPAITTQYEVQYKRAVAEINGSFSAALFYRHDADQFRRIVSGALYASPAGGFYGGTAIIGDANTWGIELDLTGKTEMGMHWALRYGFADTSDDLMFQGYSGVVGRISNTYPFVAETFADRSAKHIVTANLGYGKGDGFYGDLLLQYKSGYDNYTGFITVPTFPIDHSEGLLIANANVGYKFGNGIRLFVTGEGLFDKRYKETAPLSNQLERRVWAGIGFDF